MIRKSYNFAIKNAQHPHAVRWLAMISFIESSFFPIPPIAMLLPMGLAAPKRAVYFSFITATFATLGGIFGYLIGYFLYDTLGSWLIQTYGAEEAFIRFKFWYETYGFWVIAATAFIPLPYKVVSIGSGFLGLSLIPFIAGSAISRYTRYLIVGIFIRVFGDRIQNILDKYLIPLSIAFLALVALGFLVLKYL